MIKSMTGYGRHESINEHRRIVLEIKSVNNRYRDLSVKLPRSIGYVEDKIKEQVSKEAARGKIDVFLYVETYVSENKLVSVNLPLAENYLSALRSLSEQFGLEDDISVSTMTRFNDIFISKEEDEDKEKVWQEINACLEPALKDFVAMRAREGERIAADVRTKAAELRRLVDQIARRAPEIAREYAAHLRDNMKELLGEFPVDEGRLLTEVGVMADRACIDEELVRLSSHFQELENILSEGGAVGRKLDFLIQEINRETNTIGSKANDMEITRTVVELKSEIEKIREQVQNLE